ncbi:MAG: hypothetical protein AAFO75_12440 [Pseudomonadota bacterium]
MLMNSRPNGSVKANVTALIAPAISAALFGSMSIAVDHYSGNSPDLLNGAYLFKTALTAAAGALLSAASGPCRYGR